MFADVEMERSKNQIQIGSTMKQTKLQRCAHIHVGKDEKGRPEYSRCETLTAGRGASPDGKPVALCPSHIVLYPKLQLKKA